MDAHNENDWTQEELHREIKIQDENDCPLCGGPLHYSHTTDHVNWLVKEEAGCPHCFIRMKTKVHVLQ